MDDFLSRRHFLAMAGGAAVWLAASPAELLAAHRNGVAQPQYRALTPAQAEAFTAFAAQIIPSEPGSPGAREANVTRFLDNGLTTFAKKTRTDVEQAIVALEAQATRAHPRAKGFASLTETQQIAVMHALEKADRGAFSTLRIPAIVGMFANPSYGGNTNKVGWKLIGFEDRFIWEPPFGYYDKGAESKRT